MRLDNEPGRLDPAPGYAGDNRVTTGLLAPRNCPVRQPHKGVAAAAAGKPSRNAQACVRTYRPPPTRAII